MKAKDKKALLELSVAKLLERLKELRRERAELLMQQKIRKVKNVHEAYKKRKEIAQILTFVAEKRILEQKDGKNPS